MKQFVQNEEAVSPVIGVILMVAITVILAAVIAAFVFGMTDNVSTTKIVAATATQQNEDIIVTYKGGADAQDVTYLAFSIKNVAKGYSAETDGSIVSDSAGRSDGDVKVGTSWTFNEGTGGKDHVVVTAHFKDGSEQVVLDSFV